MKKLTNSLCARFGAVSVTTAMMTMQAQAAGSRSSNNTLAGVVAPIVTLLNNLMAPLLAVVVAVGGLYCILLGVKFAKAEEPQDREKAKSHLKNAIIGFVLIFVLIVVLNLLVPVMTTWVNTTLANNGQAGVF